MALMTKRVDGNNTNTVAQTVTGNSNAASVGSVNSVGGLSSVSRNTVTQPAAQNTADPIVAQTAEATPEAEATPTSTMRTPTTTSSVKSTSRTTTSNFQPQTYTPTGMYDPANLQAYNTQREADIRNLYSAAQQNALAGLKTAYDQNLSDAEAARDRISPQYQQSMNALSAEYERQRRNNNMQAAANGLNTGAGSQMALAQSANYHANQAGLAAKENEALNEANRQLDNLKRNYQNAIAEATAQNNYKLAAALMEEYQNAYNRQLNIENTNYQREQAIENQNYTRQWNEDERAYTRGTDEAARKAQYGDFSGYADLYGEDVARNMELTWAMQNPQMAYAAGKLSAEDYQALTGYAPAGTSGSAASGTGSYGSMGSSGSGSSDSGKYYPSNSRSFLGSVSRPNSASNRWQNYTPEERANFKLGWGRLRTGGGYSASLDKAYRGAPGYLNENGEFVTGWSDDAPANFEGNDIDYERAQAYADAYRASGGDRAYSTITAQNYAADVRDGNYTGSTYSNPSGSGNKKDDVIDRSGLK